MEAVGLGRGRRFTPATEGGGVGLGLNAKVRRLMLRLSCVHMLVARSIDCRGSAFLLPHRSILEREDVTFLD